MDVAISPVKASGGECRPVSSGLCVGVGGILHTATPGFGIRSESALSMRLHINDLFDSGDPEF